MQRGEAAQALALLERLAAQQRGNVEVLFALGTAHGMLNQDGEAEAVFRVAARLRPDLRDAHLNVAFSLVYQGRLRESIAPFLAARRLAPGDRLVDENLIAALLGILQDEPGGGPQSCPALGALEAEPLVSVVIPTRDRPRLLRDALESVARQSYRNWEAIVVNDGGAEVASVVRALAPHASARTRVLENGTSQGAARAQPGNRRGERRDSRLSR